MIKKNELKKIAFYSRIKLDDEELKNAPQEIASILEYIDKLNNIGTDGVEPLFHFPELKNIVRKDIPKTIERDVRKKMMMMGKDKDDYLKVETIIQQQ